METTLDPRKFAEQVLNDIEVTTAEAWQAVEDWDADRLRRAMADLAAHVAGWQRGPVLREAAREELPECPHHTSTAQGYEPDGSRIFTCDACGESWNEPA